MMSTATEPQTVVLRDGWSVTIAALQLLWSLEDRAFTISADDDGLYVKPHSRLTDADDAAIRAHRDDLIKLVRHCGDRQ